MALKRMAVCAAVAGVFMLTTPPVVAAAAAAPAGSNARPDGWTTISLGDQGRDACKQFYLCVWTEPNFTGGALAFTGNVRPGDAARVPAPWWHHVHSMVNNTTIPVSFYEEGGAYLGTQHPGAVFACCWPGANRVDHLRAG